jgi:hypothetical protein
MLREGLKLSELWTAELDFLGSLLRICLDIVDNLCRFR